MLLPICVGSVFPAMFWAEILMSGRHFTGEVQPLHRIYDTGHCPVLSLNPQVGLRTAE